MNADTDAKLIEEGRKLFAGEWTFISASPSIETLPPMAEAWKWRLRALHSASRA